MRFKIDPARVTESRPSCVDSSTVTNGTANMSNDSGSLAEMPFDFAADDFDFEAFTARQLELLRASDPQGPTSSSRGRIVMPVDSEDDLEDEPDLPQRKKRARRTENDTSIEVLRSQNFMKRGWRQKH